MSTAGYAFWSPSKSTAWSWVEQETTPKRSRRARLSLKSRGKSTTVWAKQANSKLAIANRWRNSSLTSLGRCNQTDWTLYTNLGMHFSSCSCCSGSTCSRRTKLLLRRTFCCCRDSIWPTLSRTTISLSFLRRKSQGLGWLRTANSRPCPLNSWWTDSPECSRGNRSWSTCFRNESCLEFARIKRVYSTRFEVG